MSLSSRSAFLTMIISATAFAVAVAGLVIGAKPMTLAEALTALASPNQGTDGIIVWTLRMPRSIAAFLAGGALAVSGFLLQSLTRNPLAAPDLTGVSSGAVAAIVSTFVFFPAISSFYYPGIGMAGGLAAASMTIWVARGGRASALHTALGGITVALFLNAITTYVLLRGGPQSPSVLFWLSGGFQGRSWPQIMYMLPWIVSGLAVVVASHRVIGVLALGDEVAAGMGVNLSVWKPLLLLAAIGLVAGVTPVAGPVAFVGLAAPHLVRLLRPRDSFWSLMLNLAIGGGLLLTADVLARSVAAPREIPVSIFTAMIGGPIFIYLAQRREIFMGRGALA
ncbi:MULTISPECIES: FecCD family ABC transporter permease [Sinorhizobium]|uniref:Ferrichrome ABC transporter permease n=2 Tax=Sinorhizobium TaxID=28105 RepID=A0A2S3YNX9_9HYPH|nr:MULTISPECIES: iron ABC transporter permease [Sinorhizobium]AUX76440.1 iron-siderophore ABC transporter permease protein [Sinorhizobium fredii]PDT42692.1 iron ABC transporter permease [Sinorhizobium sp. FG01]POH32617.1 ferrichrome ABC transporter permease [Sinorhizobium americanum]